MSSGARCLSGDQSIGARCPRGEVFTGAKCSNRVMDHNLTHFDVCPILLRADCAPHIIHVCFLIN